ncbi:MAG: hypothetical protein HZA23_03000 [Nitrospirae bacterium]|nr:hypothetical protein [Nitrospirota bacterium]
MRLSRKALGVGVALLGLAFVLWTWWSESEEARILRVVDEGRRGIEARDLDRCMRQVSYHYRDEYGFTYLTAKALLQRLFERFEGFRVEMDRPTVTVQGEQATASLHLRIRATMSGMEGYLQGSDREPVKAVVRLVKERRAWRIVEVSGLDLTLGSLSDNNFLRERAT